MTARLRKFLSDMGERFWLIPGLIVAGGVLAGVALVEVDRAGTLPRWLQGPWLYDGGATGARTLLGAVASSTIGVAGTVFSITIAALSLAAGQMGPRLLGSFTRDRGNQFTLGVFLGTFSYALIVLRSVRTEGEGDFVPHLSLTIAILLAFLCVGTLVFFVGHMAGRINVDTVVEIVSDELTTAIERLTLDTPGARQPAEDVWTDATIVTDPRRGYLQQLDEGGLADWASGRGVAIRLLVRPGAFVFPGAPIALVVPAAEGAEAAIAGATALGPARVGSADLEHAVRQLVEVAVRALSPGINDPHTAISVLDRLGAALCAVAPLHLPTGVHERGGRVALVVPCVDYPGLVDAMFHMIRQNAARSPAVLIRMVEVLRAVASCERKPERVSELMRHADLVLDGAGRDVSSPADLADIRTRYDRFRDVARSGARGSGRAVA